MDDIVQSTLNLARFDHEFRRRAVRRSLGTLGAIFLAAGCVTAIEPNAPRFTPGEQLTALSSSDELSFADVTAAARSALDTNIGSAGATPEPSQASAVKPAAVTSYSMLPDVEISKQVERKIAKVATVYHRRTGKPLVITSGTRGPAEQARAMYRLLTLGTDIVALYKNKSAAQEIRTLYLRGKSRREPEATIVRAMSAAIRRQITRGVYISAHLRAGAVDVRNRDMTVTERRAFKSCVAHAGGISLLEEHKPPHFHLQIK